MVVTLAAMDSTSTGNDGHMGCMHWFKSSGSNVVD